MHRVEENEHTALSEATVWSKELLEAGKRRLAGDTARCDVR
jgi:hypothetical protein